MKEKSRHRGTGRRANARVTSVTRLRLGVEGCGAATPPARRNPESGRGSAGSALAGVPDRRPVPVLPRRWPLYMPQRRRVRGSRPPTTSIPTRRSGGTRPGRPRWVLRLLPLALFLQVPPRWGGKETVGAKNRAGITRALGPACLSAETTLSPRNRCHEGDAGTSLSFPD